MIFLYFPAYADLPVPTMICLGGPSSQPSVALVIAD